MTIARKQRLGEIGLPAHRVVAAPELETLNKNTADTDADPNKTVLVRGPYDGRYTVVAGLRGFVSQRNNAIIYAKVAGDGTPEDYATEEVEAVVAAARRKRPEPLVDESVGRWLCGVISAIEGVHSVWLFGSRANGRVHAKSDWDLLVKGSFDRSEAVRCAIALELDRSNVDLFLLSNDTEAVNPWNDKRMTLFNFSWQQLADDVAEYSSTVKSRNKNRLEERRSTAYRVWHSSLRVDDLLG